MFCEENSKSEVVSETASPTQSLWLSIHMHKQMFLQQIDVNPAASADIR